MSYEVRIVPSAEKELDHLPAVLRARIIRRFLALEGNPHLRGTKKLSGREEYRLRVGDYRVLYIVDDRNRAVTILAVGHRREVYE